MFRVTVGTQYGGEFFDQTFDAPDWPTALIAAAEVVKGESSSPVWQAMRTTTTTTRRTGPWPGARGASTSDGRRPDMAPHEFVAPAEGTRDALFGWCAREDCGSTRDSFAHASEQDRRKFIEGRARAIAHNSLVAELGRLGLWLKLSDRDALAAAVVGALSAEGLLNG